MSMTITSKCALRGGAALALWILGAAADAAPSRLDLEQARKLALQHNHAVAAARHEIEASRSARQRASAAFRPTLGLAGGAESKTNEDGSDSAGFGYLHGGVNLFNGFRDRHLRDLAEVQVERAVDRLKAIEFTVGCDVEEHFSAYLYKKALIELKKQAVARNDVHQRFVRKSRMLGLISEADVMEFQLRDAALRSELVVLEQERDDARSSLEQVLGDGLGGDVELVGQITHVHVEGDLSGYLERADAASLPVRDATAEVEKARLEKKVSEGRWLPVVGIEARAGYLPLDDRTIENKPEGAIALTARLELYGGGDTYWEEREKAAAVFASEAKLKDELSQTTHKVKAAFRNLKVIEARSDLEKNNVEFARKYYESILSEYKRGFKNSSDLSAASQTLSEAEERKIGFDFEFIKQRLDLERLLGSPVAQKLAP
jgi:outer membrane protein TolC